MNNLLQTKKEIKAWLDAYKIKNYTLTPDVTYGYVADIGGNVDLENKNLSSIDVKFNCVRGFFDCSGNQLSNLNGSPHRVIGDFYCNNNHLINLIGGPENVDGDFWCQSNRLKDLKGCPQDIGGDFLFFNNDIVDFAYCPKQVGEKIRSFNNSKLGELQKIEDFQEMYKIHQEICIQKEKNHLSQSITFVGKNTDRNYKI